MSLPAGTRRARRLPISLKSTLESQSIQRFSRCLEIQSQLGAEVTEDSTLEEPDTKD